MQPSRPLRDQAVEVGSAVGEVLVAAALVAVAEEDSDRIFDWRMANEIYHQDSKITKRLYSLEFLVPLVSWW